MTDFKLCGIVICGVILSCVFKSLKNEYSLFIRLTITIVITAASLSLFVPILAYIEKITNGTVIYSYLPVLIKILGIAIITEITADTCIDMGENGLANKIGIFAKAEILVLSMPLIESLFNMCLDLLK